MAGAEAPGRAAFGFKQCNHSFVAVFAANSAAMGGAEARARAAFGFKQCSYSFFAVFAAKTAAMSGAEARAIATFGVKQCNYYSFVSVFAAVLETTVANDKNPLLRNCLDCIATDRWLLRVCKRESQTLWLRKVCKRESETDARREKREKGKPEGNGRAAEAGGRRCRSSLRTSHWLGPEQSACLQMACLSLL